MGKGKIWLTYVYQRLNGGIQTKRSLKNYDIDKWFIEKVSGKDIKCPKLREMLEYIREDATVYVIGI